MADEWEVVQADDGPVIRRKSHADTIRDNITGLERLRRREGMAPSSRSTWRALAAVDAWEAETVERKRLLETAEQDYAQLLESQKHWRVLAERFDGEVQRLRELGQQFGEKVLFCDNYGCDAGPNKCLHADAQRFLKELDV